MQTESTSLGYIYDCDRNLLSVKHDKVKTFTIKSAGIYRIPFKVTISSHLYKQIQMLLNLTANDYETAAVK